MQGIDWAQFPYPQAGRGERMQLWRRFNGSFEGVDKFFSNNTNGGMFWFDHGDVTRLRLSDESLALAYRSHSKQPKGSPDFVLVQRVAGTSACFEARALVWVAASGHSTTVRINSIHLMHKQDVQSLGILWRSLCVVFKDKTFVMPGGASELFAQFWGVKATSPEDIVVLHDRHTPTADGDEDATASAAVLVKELEAPDLDMCMWMEYGNVLDVIQTAAPRNLTLVRNTQTDALQANTALVRRCDNHIIVDAAATVVDGSRVTNMAGFGEASLARLFAELRLLNYATSITDECATQMHDERMWTSSEFAELAHQQAFVLLDTDSRLEALRSFVTANGGLLYRLKGLSEHNNHHSGREAFCFVADPANPFVFYAVASAHINISTHTLSASDFISEEVKVLVRQFFETELQRLCFWLLLAKNDSVEVRLPVGVSQHLHHTSPVYMTGEEADCLCDIACVKPRTVLAVQSSQSASIART